MAKCPWGVDGSLVGVEDYLGPPLLSFARQAVKLVQAVVIRFVVSCNWGNTVGNDLIVESIYQQRPFPLLSLVFQYRHIRYHDLKRCLGIPVTFDQILILNAFFSRWTIPAFPGLGTNPGSLAAFMCQIVRENPTCIVKNISCKAMISKGRM